MGKDCSGLTTFLAAHASEGYRARIALVGFRGGKRGTVHLLANGVLYYFAGDLHEVALLAGRTLAPCRWSFGAILAFVLVVLLLEIFPSIPAQAQWNLKFRAARGTNRN